MRSQGSALIWVIWPKDDCQRKRGGHVGLEQQLVEPTLVVQYQRLQNIWQRKHDMKIANRA